jgi:hypothetical protein
MNSLKYIRKLAGVKPTPKNKGAMQTIKVKYYDTGLINVNGNPTPSAVAALRFIGQLFETLREEHGKRARPRNG